VLTSSWTGVPNKVAGECISTGMNGREWRANLIFSFSFFSYLLCAWRKCKQNQNQNKSNKQSKCSIVVLFVKYLPYVVNLRLWIKVF